MMKVPTTVAPPVAHLVGPGKLRVVNGRLAFSALETDADPLHKSTKGARCLASEAINLDVKSLRALFLYGGVSLSDQACQLLLEHHVPVVLLSQGGSMVLGRLASVDDSSVLLRLGQIRLLSDPRQQLELARTCVLAKLDSQREAARHYQRHGTVAAGAIHKRISDLHDAAKSASDLNRLRGYEGAGSAAWLELFGQLLLRPWEFTVRSRRPPRDPVNALLSLSATWLASRTVARLQAAGTEVALGALHEFRAGRPALACDVMEPLRVAAVERWVLDFCNHHCLRPSDFVTSTDEGTRLPQGSYGRTLAHWEAFCTTAGVWTRLDQEVESWCRRFRQFSHSPTR